MNFSNIFKDAYLSKLFIFYLYSFLISAMFFSGIFIPYLNNAGITNEQVFLLQSIYLLFIIIFNVPTGALADIFGRKKLLIFGTFLWVIGELIYGYFHSWNAFVIAELILAAGSSFTKGSFDALLYDYLKQENLHKFSKRIFEVNGMFSMIGIAFAAFLGSFISKISYSYTFFATAIAYFLAFLLSFKFNDIKIKSEPFLTTIKKGINIIKKSKPLQILIFDNAVIFSLIFPILWLYQMLLKSQNFDPFYFGILHSIFTFSQIIVLFLLPYLANFFSKKNLLLMLALIPAFSFIALSFIPYPFSIIFLILIAAFGLSRYFPFQSYLNKFIPTKYRATTLSTISSINLLIGVLTTFLISKLINFSLSITFLVIGLLILLISLFSRIEEDHLID